MILDLPVFGNPMAQTDNVYFRVVKWHFKALCNHKKSSYKEDWDVTVIRD
jgi:hypothetical protein